MSLDQRLIDKRVIRRKLEQGHVEAGAYRRMLEELPDLSGQIARDGEKAEASASPSSSPHAPVETEAPSF